MFLVRSVCEQDLNHLEELSRLENLLNLPRDREQLAKKIQTAAESFKIPFTDKSKNHYIFVLEDTSQSRVIGVSMIHGQHGTEESPHFFFKISDVKKSTPVIDDIFSHEVLELDYEPNGYSEIGGLVLHPDYRGNEYKLGKQLSFSRFLYMAMNPLLFTPVIHTELLPPLNAEGNPPLWDAIGKRFTNMSYCEADFLSRSQTDFILDLFPWKERIYKELLPREARQAIGQVSSNTRPVKAMLEKIGFHYTKEVDPFDGGPHYRCPRDEILPIKNFKHVKIKCVEGGDFSDGYLMKMNYGQFDFCCGRVEGRLEGNTLFLASPLAKELEIKDNEKTCCIPM